MKGFRPGALAAVALVVLAFGAQPAAAQHATLEGNRISLFRTCCTTFVPASEPSFVSHGWGIPLFDTATSSGFVTWDAEDKRALFDDAVWRFELWVAPAGGVLAEIPLERAIHVIGEVKTIAKSHFVQFDAGAFAPGAYTFQGRWYGDPDLDGVSTLEQTKTISVVYT